MIERMPAPPILWSPDPDVRATTRIGAYLDWLWRERGLRFAGYDDLLRWSTSDLDAFWGSIWDHFEVSSETHSGPALADETMPGARWFPTAHLNWAEHCLRLAGRLGSDTVVVARSQTRDRMTLTADELRAEVGRVRAGLERPRGRPWRPRRRLPAERPRGRRRAARHGFAGRDLDQLRAGVRRAIGRRPIQPGRAEGAPRGRRLPIRGARGGPRRRGGRHPRRAPEPRRDRRSSPTSGPMRPASTTR